MQLQVRCGKGSKIVVSHTIQRHKVIGNADNI